MYAAKIKALRETREGTILEVLLPFESKTDEINRLKGKNEYLSGAVHFHDGRMHSPKQHRAIFAIIGDISKWWADDREWTRSYFQGEFCGKYGIDDFSLSYFGKDKNLATVTLAREFITFLLESCMREGIPLSENGLSLTDDIEKYLHLCIKYRKCAICGRTGEIHHVDAIGMGRDRTTYNDTGHKKICLCREHHSEAHSLGTKQFNKKYHVFGIVYTEKGCEDYQ